MLPGKKYTPEDVIKILRKRMWLVAVPWAVIAVSVAWFARQLPDQYKTQATIQMVPPQVPEAIVRSLTPSTFAERLAAVQTGILSRNRLETLIKEFDLYREERGSKTMQQVVERMITDIKVTPLRGDAFSVTYTGRDPEMVMRVTARLAGYFKDESINVGKRRAEGTNDFVESAVEEAHAKLVVIEDKLKKYRMSHAGELPTQLTANITTVATMSSGLNNIGAALANDADRQSRLEHDIEALESSSEATAPPPPPPAGSQVGTFSGSAAQMLAQAKAALTEATEVRGYKPGHPTVDYLNRQIANLTKQVEIEAQRVPLGAGAAVSPAEQARLAKLAAYREELDIVKKRIDANRKEETRLKAGVASYQAKIDNTPVRDAELVELTRDYEVLNQTYKDFVAKQQASNMSVNLQLTMRGEQFNLIDEARLPEKPFSPDRIVINFAGILGGLVVGLSLVALLEFRDMTFKADYEVASVLSLPVLAVVPLMRSDAEKRAAFRKAVLMNIGFGSVVVVCLAALAYTFVR